MKRILAIDDQPDVTAIIEDSFSSKDYEVTTASSGAEALSIIENGYRGFIFLDISMPEMDGWETLKKMVERNLIEGNVIAMLTSTSTPGPRGAELSQYVVEYVKKPIEPQRLLEIVETYIDFCSSQKVN